MQTISAAEFRLINRAPSQKPTEALSTVGQLIEAGAEVGRITGTVQCRERLGGLLRYYYRDAA